MLVEFWFCIAVVFGASAVLFREFWSRADVVNDTVFSLRSCVLSIFVEILLVSDPVVSALTLCCEIDRAPTATDNVAIAMQHQFLPFLNIL